MKKLQITDEVKEQCLQYLKEHIQNVNRALDILLPYIKKPLKLTQKDVTNLRRLISFHDKSKYQNVEFLPYADHFFGRKKLIDEDFKIAVTLHKARNPHHPEFWDKGNGQPINMPKLYIIEMICDWWSFSIAQNKPLQTLEWYKKKKSKFHLSEKTQKIVEKMLAIIKENFAGKSFDDIE